ncbi:hypothetical protein VNO77_37578 [Canavalia gladiata]|uniref:Uncharacterized protein n=1 Tax=Canavalia gladiata TaxID=3824 RepID=A0AAN9K921_CANGL
MNPVAFMGTPILFGEVHRPLCVHFSRSKSALTLHLWELTANASHSGHPIACLGCYVYRFGKTGSLSEITKSPLFSTTNSITFEPRQIGSRTRQRNPQGTHFPTWIKNHYLRPCPSRENDGLIIDRYIS